MSNKKGLMKQVVYVLMAKRNISTLKISVVWNDFEILGLRHCGGGGGLDCILCKRRS